MNILVEKFMNWEVREFDPKDWNDLMEVVQKLREIYDDSEMVGFGFDAVIRADKHDTYQAIKNCLSTLGVDWSVSNYEVIYEAFVDSNKIEYVLRCEKGDRTIHVLYDFNLGIIGLDFMQGLDIDPDEFNGYCIHLTEIYIRLSVNNLMSIEGKINKAIDLYSKAFIFQQ